MSNRLDVAARLAEGRPAVEHTQTYVWACHLLGYHHPELADSRWQVRDWYDSEDGLDLQALDDDCAHLWSVVRLAEEALRIQAAQIAALAGAWIGPGAAIATQFLDQHCDAAQAVIASVRAAAEGCVALGEELWDMVDGKVRTAVEIDDRRLAERPAWLSAAQAVAAGVGDRSIVEGLIHQQVNPYVNNDIRDDWLAAMHAASASAAVSYDVLIGRLTAAPPVLFEIPGELGSPVAAALTPAAIAPRAETMAPAPADVSPRELLDPVAPPSPVPSPPPIGNPSGLLPTAPAWGTGSGDAFGMPAGASSSGGSLGGLVGQIIEAMGDLLGSATEQPGDSSVGAPAAFDEVPEAGAEEVADDDVADASAAAAEVTEPPAAALSAESPSLAESAPPGDLPAAPQPLPIAEPLGQQPEEQTACEIAADELPQAGR